MKNKNSVSCKYKSVLLIDDNEIDNFINERIITSSNFSESVIVKNSAKVALDYIREFKGEKTEFPELIFLDLNMPTMDGFAFLSEYDGMADWIKQQCKVIVLSSSISPEDINKASVNPYVYKFLNKPLSEKYLEAINL